MENFKETFEKAKAYEEVIPQVESMIDGVENRVGALANVTALLKDAFPYYFWVGFYIVNGNVLELGPFQGPVACYTIKKGKGVCGTAWEKAETVIVPNVHQFPGHIVCSTMSNSEIVVPMIKNGEVIAVIDVDSSEFSSFDETDKDDLERIAEIIVSLF